MFKVLDSQLEDERSASNPVGDFRFRLHRKIIPCSYRSPFIPTNLYTH
jgi:hypothetical protein